MATIRVNDTITLDDRCLEERFVRASGPGGQNVNKVATAVELRFDVRSSSLPSEAQERLSVLAGNRMTTDGILLIDSRQFRTQVQNREAARDRLVALVRRALEPRRKRRPTRPRAAAREHRLVSKKIRGTIKASRQAGRGRQNDD